jgi:hypothetical protein
MSATMPHVNASAGHRMTVQGRTTHSRVALGIACMSLLSLLLGLTGCAFPGSAQGGDSTAPATYGGTHVLSVTFPSDDIVVANAVVTDAPYHADTSGARDATSAIQAALDDRYHAGGGVVWVPAGKYRLTGSIYVPPHVTLRGDWRDPDSGSGSYGTVVLADVPSGGEADHGLIRISGSAGVKGLTVYYPNQSATSPISYPYTFEILGTLVNGDGYMLSTVQDVTLLDSYRGISAGAHTVHEMHTIRHVRGTVLATGMYLEDSADVSHNEEVTFDNAYWAALDPSLGASRPARAQIDAWTRAHATGMQLGGLDWDQFANIALADENVGLDIVPYRRGGISIQLFGIHVENSHIAFRISGDYVDGRFGINIANSTLHANQGVSPVAVQLGDNTGASILFNDVTLGGGAANAVQLLGNDMAEFQNCTFDSWSGSYAITAGSGTLVVEGSRFAQPLSAASRGIRLQPGVSSSTILGSSLSGDPVYLLDNASAGTVYRQEAGFLFNPSHVSGYTFHALPRPSSTRLFNVLAPPYTAHADGGADDTGAIQHALDDAGKVGGGTVYLPPGTYLVKGHLRVPAGVELRGSDDVPHRTMHLGAATGTILFASEGRATATPETDIAFITLDGDHAGVRGIGIDYPEQPNDSPAHIVAYPWTIRGKGTGVYAYAVAFVNAYQGIDFATYPTDGHYLNAMNGFVLKTGIQVGNSGEGWVEDTVFNINAWGRAYGLPNILSDDMIFPVAAGYSQAHERAFLVTAGARNEHLMNDFVYGAQTGLTFDATATAVGINVAADGTQNTVNVAGTGPGGVTLLNVEGCGCGLGGVGLTISSGSANIFNLLSVDYYKQAITINGGAFALIGAAFNHNTATVTGGTGVIAGALFRDAGPQVAVSGASTIANLWGNIGGGGFTFTATNGAAQLYTGNIPR